MNSLIPITFIPEQVYRRRDLHECYGGQERGGICTPTQFPIILLFTGDAGTSFGYYDGWDDGVFKYTGEGQVGDMTFVRGNRAIRDHLKDGKDLHLFRSGKPGLVQYVGQMVCVGYSWSRTLDFKQQERQAIVFNLQFLNDQPLSNEKSSDKALDLSLSLEALRRKALESPASPILKKEEKLVDVRVRSAAVRLYALKRADGHCEACRKIAPFKTALGELFLECHHLRRLTDGGPDQPDWVAGVCPNCHRHVHYGADGTDLNESLIKIVRKKEEQFSWKN